MKILLVNPPRWNNDIPVIREDRCEVTDRYAIIPPYSLLCMASILLDKGHEVSLIDANARQIDYEQLTDMMIKRDPKIILFRFTPTTFIWDMELVSRIKMVRPQTITIGICHTLESMGMQVMEKAKDLDYYLPRDWESILPSLIGNIESHVDFHCPGVYIRSQGGVRFENQNSIDMSGTGNLPFPAYSLLGDLALYRPNAPVDGNFMVLYASKGCPFSCTYCTVAKTRFKLKSTDAIVEELSELYHSFSVRQVSFFDETFTLDRRRVIEICEKIRNEMPDLRWYCNTRVNLVDDELLFTMREAGCRGISFGIESGCQRILDNVKKGIKCEEAENAILAAKRNGLKVYASFIFGLPGEDLQSIRETREFVRRTLPHGAQFNVAVPYPGTALFEYAKREHLLLGNATWEDLVQHRASMRTDALTMQEIEDARNESYKDLYLNPRWIMENIVWILNHPDDLTLGIRYYVKSLSNLLIHRMEHSH